MSSISSFVSSPTDVGSSNFISNPLSVPDPHREFRVQTEEIVRNLEKEKEKLKNLFSDEVLGSKKETHDVLYVANCQIITQESSNKIDYEKISNGRIILTSKNINIIQNLTSLALPVPKIVCSFPFNKIKKFYPDKKRGCVVFEIIKKKILISVKNLNALLNPKERSECVKNKSKIKVIAIKALQSGQDQCISEEIKNIDKPLLSKPTDVLEFDFTRKKKTFNIAISFENHPELQKNNIIFEFSCSGNSLLSNDKKEIRVRCDKGEKEVVFSLCVKEIVEKVSVSCVNKKNDVFFNEIFEILEVAEEKKIGVIGENIKCIERFPIKCVMIGNRNSNVSTLVQMLAGCKVNTKGSNNVYNVYNRGIASYLYSQVPELEGSVAKCRKIIYDYELWDVNGHEWVKEIRKIALLNANVVCLTYSVHDIKSLECVEEYYNELEKKEKSPIIFLVGVVFSKKKKNIFLQNKNKELLENLKKKMSIKDKFDVVISLEHFDDSILRLIARKISFLADNVLKGNFIAPISVQKRKIPKFVRTKIKSLFEESDFQKTFKMILHDLPLVGRAKEAKIRIFENYLNEIKILKDVIGIMNLILKCFYEQKFDFDKEKRISDYFITLKHIFLAHLKYFSLIKPIYWNVRDVTLDKNLNKDILLLFKTAGMFMKNGNFDVYNLFPARLSEFVSFLTSKKTKKIFVFWRTSGIETETIEYVTKMKQNVRSNLYMRLSDLAIRPMHLLQRYKLVFKELYKQRNAEDVENCKKIEEIYASVFDLYEKFCKKIDKNEGLRKTTAVLLYNHFERLYNFKLFKTDSNGDLDIESVLGTMKNYCFHFLNKKYLNQNFTISICDVIVYRTFILIFTRENNKRMCYPLFLKDTNDVDNDKFYHVDVILCKGNSIVLYLNNYKKRICDMYVFEKDEEVGKCFVEHFKSCVKHADEKKSKK